VSYFWKWTFKISIPLFHYSSSPFHCLHTPQLSNRIDCQAAVVETTNFKYISLSQLWLLNSTSYHRMITVIRNAPWLVTRNTVCQKPDNRADSKQMWVVDGKRSEHFTKSKKCLTSTGIVCTTQALKPYAGKCVHVFVCVRETWIVHLWVTSPRRTQTQFPCLVYIIAVR